MNTEQQFLQALQDYFEQYQQFGARSNKKLIPIHSWLAKIIIDNLDDTFKIHSLGYSKEIKLLGKYYQKTLDIAITKEEKQYVLLVLNLLLLTINKILIIILKIY